jgi:hypothetical protein
MKLTIQRSMAAAIWLTACIAWMWTNGAARAQGFTTTTVQGTVYLANGKPGSGVLQLSWPAFSTANNQAIAAGRTNVTIGADGYVSVNLAPNQGATPAGLYYTAVYHLSDGTTSTEYWVVPEAAQAGIAQVRAQVMPAAQAVQAVSKGYVDQSITELTQSLLTASGGSLTGPLFLNSDPTQPAQAATKRYVDNEFANALPASGGVASGPLTSVQLGAAYQVDQFSGADFGAKLQACLNRLDAVYGGTCDARNFAGSQAMGSTLTIATANATVQLPCATIATSKQIRITAATRNVTFHGCALRGASNASGSQGGTVLLYSGTGPMLQVGDPTYAVDTLGFHIDNVVMNTTASTDAAAQGLTAYRTQEMNLEGLYLLGNSNQTGMTLDGTGNYTGGTFQDIQISGFGTALNAIGHQVSNAAATDWLNASTFVRLHINCPTNGGNPISGTYGINLVQGDGNTFTGGDVEGCATALHLGPNAQNNTIVGLRNENSLKQVVADAGSSYNNWMTGGTMFTGQLSDNGTRNSFLDTFHRSFNGLNGDWYGSQADATVTNHYRIGTGSGTERGLLDRYQTDYGYRWTTGLSDASAGEQFYQVFDELNNVNRVSIGQYNHGYASTNNQTVINAAGTGAVVLNGSANAGTGGVIIGSGGAAGSTVATINSAGNAQFNGTLQVGGASTFTNSTTVKNQADAEIDNILWAGTTANQKESFTYKDYSGASQWYMVKDANNNWALNSAMGGLDSIKAYQSNNSGDTYINASNGSGHIRMNYEPGAGSETDIYSGPSATLVAAFLGSNSIKFPGLAATSGRNCLQIDNSGYLSNTGSACASSGGVNGTVNSGNAGQVAYYAGNGSVIAGTTSVAVSAGGTGATNAAGALQNLGAQAAMPGVAADGALGVVVGGKLAAAAVSAAQVAGTMYASQYGDKSTNGIATASGGASNQMVIADPSYATAEQPGLTSFSATPFHYQDQRQGQQTDFYHNPPTSLFNPGLYPLGAPSGKKTYCLNDGLTNATTPSYTVHCEETGQIVNSPGWNYGSNSLGGGWGWQTSIGKQTGVIVRSSGITQSENIFQYKYGVGDNIAKYIYVYGEGGGTAGADEQNKIYAGALLEDTDYFAGTCSTGCTTGSALIKTDVTNAKQGTLRYLIDLTKGATYTGTVTAVSAGLGGGSAVAVSATVPVSTVWGTLASTVSSPNNQQSPFSTSETFNVNIAGGSQFDTTHLVCFAGNYHDQAIPTKVETPSNGVQSITIPLRAPHGSGTYVYQGGMCGHGLELTAYTFNGLKYLFDIVGSTDAHTLQVIAFGYSVGGPLPTLGTLANLGQTFGVTSAFTCTDSGGTLPNCSGAYAGGGGLGGGFPNVFSGTTFVMSGFNNSVLNQNCTNTAWTDGTHFTCTEMGISGVQAAGSTGAAALPINGFNAWPIAAVIDVQNETLSPPQVDGTLGLEPNLIQFASGDTVNETHHYTSRWTHYSGSMIPQNPFSQFTGLVINSSGKGTIGGNLSTGSNAFISAQNLEPAATYMGYGGILTPPNFLNVPGLYYAGLNFGHGPANLAPFINLQLDSTQYNNPAYSFSFLRLNDKNGFTQFMVTPYSGDLSISTGTKGNLHLSAGDGTGAAPSSPVAGIVMDSPVTNNADTTSKGNNTLGAAGKTNTLHGTTTIDNANITAGSFPATGITPGTYNNANVTVGADGRITGIMNGTGGGGYPTVVAGQSFTGLTATNSFPYNVTADGTYRISVTHLVTTACTSGSIQDTAYIYPVAGHYGSSAYNPSCTTQWSMGTTSYTQHAASGTVITGACQFNSVTGSPVYNMDVVIERLQ